MRHKCGKYLFVGSLVDLAIVSRAGGGGGEGVGLGGGLEAPLSFKMTQWSCYCIGESVCYWLEKGNSMDT